MRARLAALLGLAVVVLLTAAACGTGPAEPSPHGRMPVWDGGP